MSTTTSTVISEFDSTVISLIEKWLSHGERTRNHLCKLSNFRRQSLNDVLNGKSSLINYHPTRVVRLVSVIEGIEINDVLKKYSSALSEIERNGKYPVMNSIDLELSSNEEFTDVFVETMKNPVALAIYGMSLVENGVLESLISEKYGSYSKEILADLLEKKIIVRTGSSSISYHAINQEILNLTNTQVQKLIPSLNKSYKVAHARQGRNYIGVRIGDINQKTLYKIHEAYVQLDNTISKLLREDSSRGKIPFYGFFQLDTFTDKID